MLSIGGIPIRRGGFTRKKLREQMLKEHPELVAMFEERRRLLDEQLERKWPDVYALVLKQREKDSRSK